MGPSEVPPSAFVVARVGVVVAAVCLAGVAFATPWWTLEYRTNAQPWGPPLRTVSTFEARPFDQGGFAEAFDRNLTTGVQVGGFLYVGALAGVLGFAVADVRVLLGLATPFLVRVGTLVASSLLGAASALYAMLRWPRALEWNDIEPLSFWDHWGDDSRDGTRTTTFLDTHASLGWWLALVGTVALPLIAWGLSVLARSYNPFEEPRAAVAPSTQGATSRVAVLAPRVAAAQEPAPAQASGPRRLRVLGGARESTEPDEGAGPR